MARRKRQEPREPRRQLPDPTLGPSVGIPQQVLDAAHAATGPMPVTDPLIGTKLAERYRVLEKIGEGGMGRIYLAEDIRLGKKVVVKMLPPAFAGKTELAERFVQEAKLTSQIEQENIVSITDLVVTSPPFYVMEHLRGQGLGSLLHEAGRLQWDERTKDILAQVCRAVGAAHKIGIVHRDLKPDNIFLVEHSDGRLFAKILDFGIAKLLSESGVEAKAGTGSTEFVNGPTGRHNLTNIGMVLGTPHYMAPEQGMGGSVDHRSDIYSVGVIMYELLTGQVPFDIPGLKSMDFEAAGKILEMHAGEPLVPPRARRPEANIPEEVEAVIIKAMSKDPAGRFADIREMEAAIAKCAAPRHKPRPKAAAAKEGSPGIAPAEGLARIMKAEEGRARMGRIKTWILIGAVAAAAAGGAALGATGAFQGFAPSVDAMIMDSGDGKGAAPSGQEAGPGDSGRAPRTRDGAEDRPDAGQGEDIPPGGRRLWDSLKQ